MEEDWHTAARERVNDTLACRVVARRLESKGRLTVRSQRLAHHVVPARAAVQYVEPT